MRLLIPISVQFAVRYVVRSGLLELLRKTCEPIIMLAWEDSDLEAELKHGGCMVLPMPRVERSKRYARLREAMNLLSCEKLASPSLENCRAYRDLRNSDARRVVERFYRVGAALVSGLPGVDYKLTLLEKKWVSMEPSYRDIAQVLAPLKIDAVLSLTPTWSREGMVVRVLSDMGVPTCAAILSFDNITTRGWIPVRFDRYLVWNRYNAAELLRGYPATQREAVEIVGSPQFDFYYRRDYLWAREVWEKRLGIPTGRTVILFAGGLDRLAPQEPWVLKHLDDAIESREITGKPIILLRRHPNDSEERWHQTCTMSKHVVARPAWNPGATPGQCNVLRTDIEGLVSTLYHSAVHISTASTMTVDGAVFDKPQIGLAYDDRHGSAYGNLVRGLYQREHLLPIANSGGLEIVRSREELIRAVNLGLSDPERLSEGRRRLVQEINSFTDGRCTERVADAVWRFLSRACPSKTSAMVSPA